MQDWSPYAIGGATRPDSFSAMTPEMQSGLWNLLQAADSELGGGLQVYSGYRSPELQAQLYENALAKYGSEAAARKWVAPPGRSKHNSGQAADLKYNGVRIDKLPENHPVRAWLAENVTRFGLSQPMSWEPWQVEAAGARGGPPPNALTQGGGQSQGQPAAQPAPQAPQNALAQQSQPQPPQFRANLLNVSDFLSPVQPVAYRSFT